MTEAQRQRKRLLVMAGVNLAAVVIAVGFMVAWAKFGVAWAFPVFIATLAAGFGAQIWFIVGFRRKGA